MFPPIGFVEQYYDFAAHKEAAEKQATVVVLLHFRRHVLPVGDILPLDFVRNPRARTYMSDGSNKYLPETP